MKKSDELKPTVKLKIFMNEDGVSCVLTDTHYNVEVELIDEAAIENADVDCGRTHLDENPVDDYIDALIEQGFHYVDEDSVVVTNSLDDDE